MTDIYSKEFRSYVMSQVKSINTKPEILVRKGLFAMGFRYRLHDKRLPGKPDIVLKKFRTVVFVHGCFWHGHHCKRLSMPKSRVEWWTKKVSGNKKRDAKYLKMLKKMGWTVIVVYECRLKRNIYDQTLRKIANSIRATR